MSEESISQQIHPDHAPRCPGPPDRFKFSAVGIWDRDCSLRFYEPKTRGWVGSYYRAIGHVLDNAIPVHWLCVEFDQPVPLATTRKMISRLIEHGFTLRLVDRWNFTFENCRHAS